MPLHSLIEALKVVSWNTNSGTFSSKERVDKLVILSVAFLILPLDESLIKSLNNTACVVINQHSLEVWNALLVAQHAVKVSLPHIKDYFSFVFFINRSRFIFLFFWLFLDNFKFFSLLVTVSLFIDLVFKNLNLVDLFGLKVDEAGAIAVYNKHKWVRVKVKMAVGLSIVTQIVLVDVETLVNTVILKIELPVRSAVHVVIHRHFTGDCHYQNELPGALLLLLFGHVNWMGFDFPDHYYCFLESFLTLEIKYMCMHQSAALFLRHLDFLHFPLVDSKHASGVSCEKRLLNLVEL